MTAFSQYSMRAPKAGSRRAPLRTLCSAQSKSAFYFSQYKTLQVAKDSGETRMRAADSNGSIVLAAQRGSCTPLDEESSDSAEACGHRALLLPVLFRQRLSISVCVCLGKCVSHRANRCKVQVVFFLFQPLSCPMGKRGVKDVTARTRTRSSVPLRRCAALTNRGRARN